MFENTARGLWRAPDRLTDDQVSDLYQLRVDWLKRLGRGHPSEIIRSELRGHDLMCFCALDRPCHVDTLLRIANE
jgi:hypothetical protein